MDSREQRIATLAATLKSSGIAKSEAQAKMMAEDMVGVEDKIQKKTEEHNAAAHEYIQTAKNLGDSRRTSQVTPQVAPVIEAVKPPIRNVPTDNRIESKPVQESTNTRSTVHSPVAHSDSYPNVGISLSGSKSDAPHSHDTHNSALEAIKAQISQEHIVPLYDQYMDKSKEQSASNDFVDYTKIGVTNNFKKPDAHDFKHVFTPEPSVIVSTESYVESSAPIVSQLPHESSHKIEFVELESLHETVSSIVSESNASEPNEKTTDIEEIIVVKETVVSTPDVTVSEIEVVEIPVSDISSNNSSESNIKESNAHNSTVSSSEGLDAQKLVELMEEDGKMEEHTREIKSKPENAKPRESYVENNIDLSDVFKFKR